MISTVSSAAGPDDFAWHDRDELWLIAQTYNNILSSDNIIRYRHAIDDDITKKGNAEALPFR